MISTVTTDPYQVLGVSKDATTAAIRSAYRKLVLQTHPDKVQDESLRAAKQDEFQRIQQAYEILSDETKKQQYDDQVEFAQHKRDLYADIGRGGVGERFEVRTAAPSREFDRRYEERKARRSSEEELLFDEYPARKFGAYGIRRTSRTTHEDRKVGRDPDEERERIRRDHLAEQKAHSERHRTRQRELRQGREEKSYKLTTFDDEDEENLVRISINGEEQPRRKSSDTRRREGRSTGDDFRREPLRKWEPSNIHDTDRTDRKMSNAREYIQRSATFYVSSTIPIEESTVRRSSARRSSDRDRDRTRRSGHSKSSRRESTRESSPIEIVEPSVEYETRPQVIPSMPTSTSSPANIRIPLTPKAAPSQPPRSATMQVPREAYPETPSLSRASTMPVNGFSSFARRRDPVASASSKLKASMTAQFDSGYSSPSPEPSPAPSATRHGGEYIVIQDVGPKYPTSSNRRRMAVVESDDEDDDRHERSVSPHTRGRSSEHTARPSLGRAGTATARLSPSHTVSYVYRGPSSRPTMAESPSYRKGSSASTVTATRGSPALLRTGTGGTPTTHHSSSRRSYGEGSYSPQEIHYSPQIRPEDIRYTESRRSGGVTETIYRDTAPHPSRSHFVHGPHLRRAETSI